eukprot:TRINITY_DN56283_c0_g1_i1.p1 TRINITY_DN56283_c0_g1~~TRINITY_DN56283_c0_g1_i1.p1  ORF type:complete len:471 (+),score=139.61 TRINITY_DN56283_c0_g1_i1:166-1578(+)
MASKEQKEEQEKVAMEREIERFKLKKLIKHLSSARGNGTSMITLMMTPKDQIAQQTKLLTQEQSTAVNIKSHVNKLSVLTAIASVQQRLKQYRSVPATGLAIFCGTVVMEDNKEKKLTIDVVPFKPIARTMYMCDNKFHVEPLADMLESDDKFGFIVMDGHGCLFATLQGSSKEVLQKISVDLPKKHGRGGQSSGRFARIRLGKRHAYVRKISEMATQCFITNDKPNVVGLVLAGSADFKKDLSKSDLFDCRLFPIVLKMVDVAYGNENGFNQAIELSSDVLSGVRFVQEKKLISRCLAELTYDSQKFCAGVEETMQALEIGAVKTLVVWEELPHLRVSVQTPEGPRVYHVLQEDISKTVPRQDREGNAYELEMEPLVEWLAEHYRKFGCMLEFVTNKSSEGIQFCRGFGGMGALLQYAVDFKVLRESSSAAPGDAAAAGAPAEDAGASAKEEEEKPKGAVAQFTDDDFM